MMNPKQDLEWRRVRASGVLSVRTWNVQTWRWQAHLHRSWAGHFLSLLVLGAYVRDQI